MNAPLERGSENFLRVQALIFNLMFLHGKKGGDDIESSDIKKQHLLFGPIFRRFAELLHVDLDDDWGRAEAIARRLETLEESYGALTPEEASELSALECSFNEYHQRILALVGPHETELAEALDVLDVDRVKAILDRCIEEHKVTAKMAVT